MTALGKLFRTTAFKLSLAYCVLFAIGAGLVLSDVSSTIKGLFDEQVGQTVDAEITGLSEQYAQTGIRGLVQVIERRTREPGASLYLLTTFAGETVAGNISGLPNGLVDQPGLVEITYRRAGPDARQHRALARFFSLPAGFRLVVGRDVEDRETLRRVMGRALVTSLLWLTAIGTLGGLFVARRLLRRVDGMTETAQTIMAGDLSRRLSDAGTGDELDRLAANLNAMLDRIGVLMQGMRDVSDNIAHDLRTPLTRLRNRAEQALAGRDAAASDESRDLRAALEKVIEESDGLMRVFDALLMIARAESDTGDDGMVTVDVASVARDVGELYEPLAEADGLEMIIDAGAEVSVRGSRELIGQALSNLVDNALKYGVPASAPDLRISVRAVAGRAEIVVADRGPGIPAGDQKRVLDRFVRLEKSRSQPGFGLGLSLVSAIARRHGGALHLEDNAPGLRAVLTLPLAVGPLGLPAPREHPELTPA